MPTLKRSVATTVAAGAALALVSFVLVPVQSALAASRSLPGEAHRLTKASPSATPDPAPEKYTCGWYAATVRHYVGGAELKADKRSASKPYVQLTMKGAPVPSVGGGTVTFSTRIFLGSTAKKLPSKAKLDVRITQDETMVKGGTHVYKDIHRVTKATTAAYSFKLHLAHPGFVNIAVIGKGSGATAWNRVMPTAAGCVQKRQTMPALSTESFLGYSTSTLAVDGNANPPIGVRIYEKQTKSWVQTDFGRLQPAGDVEQPDQDTHWNQLHWTQTYRLEAEGNYYTGYSNEVTVTVLPHNRGQSAAGDSTINGDDDTTYDLQLQIAKAYCEGLGNLIRAPGRVPGLLAPELEVLTSLEGDFTEGVCNQDDEILFDMLDNSGEYLVDLLLAEGKDAVAEKVVEGAVKAVLDEVQTAVPQAARYISAWIVDTAWDAAHSAISNCTGVCSDIANGATSIFHAITSLGSFFGLSVEHLANRAALSQERTARQTFSMAA